MSEAKSKVNKVWLNVIANFDVVFNTLLRFGGLRLNSTYGFKLHYTSLGPTGLEGSLRSPSYFFLKN